MVSPMVMSRMPLRAMMLPAVASVTGLRPRPSNSYRMTALAFLAGLIGVMVVADGDLLVLLQGHTALDAADGDAAHKLVIVDGGHQHLEGLHPASASGAGI